jgi:hypothetical protein
MFICHRRLSIIPMSRFFCQHIHQLPVLASFYRIGKKKKKTKIRKELTAADPHLPRHIRKQQLPMGEPPCVPRAAAPPHHTSTPGRDAGSPPEPQTLPDVPVAVAPRIIHHPCTDWLRSDSGMWFPVITFTHGRWTLGLLPLGSLGCLDRPRPRPSRLGATNGWLSRPLSSFWRQT